MCTGNKIGNSAIELPGILKYTKKMCKIFSAMGIKMVITLLRLFQSKNWI